jgi:hypothetical protein
MRAEFDDFAVIVSRGVAEDGLRVSRAEGFVEIGVVEGWVEVEFCGVVIEERAVRFGDGDDLRVGAVEGVGEEAVGVAVDEAGDCDAEGRFAVGAEDEGEEECEC